MSNGDAANHWRAIEEEKLRKQIMELEDDRDNWKALASQINTDWIPANKQMADRIAELTAQKTRSQEHYIKLLNDAEAENQRLRELFDRWESSGDVVAASYAMQAKLVQGGGE